jgi:FMN reductase
VVGIAGTFSQPSRTGELVAKASERAALLTIGRASVCDLNDFGPSLGAASQAEQLDAKATEILDQMLSADALVVGSPVYKGSYTGL